MNHGKMNVAIELKDKELGLCIELFPTVHDLPQFQRR
jgi:hypothetical protein